VIALFTTDEEADFKKGNTISINADRTLNAEREEVYNASNNKEDLLESFLVKIKKLFRPLLLMPKQEKKLLFFL
jgi:hypothetical protein